MSKGWGVAPSSLPRCRRFAALPWRRLQSARPPGWWREGPVFPKRGSWGSGGSLGGSQSQGISETHCSQAPHFPFGSSPNPWPPGHPLSFPPTSRSTCGRPLPSPPPTTPSARLRPQPGLGGTLLAKVLGRRSGSLKLPQSLSPRKGRRVCPAPHGGLEFLGFSGNHVEMALSIRAQTVRGKTLRTSGPFPM